MQPGLAAAAAVAAAVGMLILRREELPTATALVSLVGLVSTAVLRRTQVVVVVE